jgi:type IX secretion system PorP/SprF family membrane protein
LSIASPVGRKKNVRSNPGIRTGSSYPIKNPEVGTGKFKHAIGGQVLADQYGAFRKMQFSGTYAIHIPISKTVNMSFGTKVGLSNNTFIQNRALVLDPDIDKTYVTYTSNNSRNNILDLGAGLYLYSNRFFIGVAADQLTKNLVKLGSGSANFDSKMYFNAIGGLKLKLNNNVTISPSFLVKYMSPAPLTIECSVQLEYLKRFWAGISYRNTDAIIGMFGMNVNSKMKFGYSFDYAVSRFNKYSYGSHELVLGIMF